ncbi:MAG: YcnI family protein [Microbacterium sp.]|nr:YcnI family protein [Microbacterium sp.]
MRSITTKLAVGLVTGAVIAVAAPLAASAHVSVSPDELVAGDHGVLTFSFSHGCETSPTTSLRITMPEGLASVAPTMDGDWTVDVERGSDGLVSAVTYTAVTPVPIDLRGAVSMSVGLDDKTPDTLVFPVLQTCVEGSTDWSQLAKKGEDPHSLEAPAPVVTVAAATGDGGHDGMTMPDAGEKETASAPDLTGTLIGAGGLVAGVAALVVAVLAYRRRA